MNGDSTDDTKADTNSDASGMAQRLPQQFTPTPEQLRARRRRNIAIALAIGIFAVFFYVITLAKLGVGILNRPL